MPSEGRRNVLGKTAEMDYRTIEVDVTDRIMTITRRGPTA